LDEPRANVRGNNHGAVRETGQQFRFIALEAPARNVQAVFNGWAVQVAKVLLVNYLWRDASVAIDDESLVLERLDDRRP
jgi:hypothetical protein